MLWFCAAAAFPARGEPLSPTQALREREPEQRGPVVSCVGMTVSDLDRAAEWYTGVLAFEKVSEAEHAGDAVERLTGVFGCRVRTARLRLGDEFIELTQYLAPEGRPIPADSRSNDQWFQHIAIVVPDMVRAYDHLRAHRVRHASSGPQRLPDWNPNAGGIEAFYFKDPDGHTLEVIKFPEGKGDPRWREIATKQAGRLFLGIDHTAIVVRDTERSIAFYRDTLGLRVVGVSENFGIEQERLNNIFGARLRITAMRGSTGPGIEFLEYLAPTDGRLSPSDARPNDLSHWQVTVTGSSGDAAPHFTPASGAFGLALGSIIRDPDGHAVLIGEP